jgi:gag-polyprotein putative aspartyl protease
MDWKLDLRLRSTRGLILISLLAPMLSTAQPGVVRLPFRAVNSLILVEAKVNGRPVMLLLDTGANRTILNAKAYGIAHLPLSQPVNRGPGIVGNALRLRVDLELAHEFLFSQPVSVMNLDELAQHFGIHFDGLLGQDILNQFRSMRIDYKTHTIELER